MAKNNRIKHWSSVSKPPASAGYLRKPAAIGPLIEQLVKEKNLSRIYLAQVFNCSRRNIKKIYKQRKLSMDALLKWSEVLQVNLLLLYNPNVLPETNPLQEELDKAKGEIERLLISNKQIPELEKEIIAWEAKCDLLDAKLDKYALRLGR